MGQCTAMKSVIPVDAEHTVAFRVQELELNTINATGQISASYYCNLLD